MAFEFKESLLSGGEPEDNMTVRHLRMAGTSREVGKAMARLAAERYDYSPPDSPDPLVTEANQEYLHDVWPAHFARMQGVADETGLGLTPDRYFDEVYYSPGTPTACSNVYYPNSATGHAWLSRNYDFSTGRDPISTAEPYLMEVYAEESYPYLCMCTYDLLGGAADGVNSEGLAVALLADVETAVSVTDPDVPPVTFDLEGRGIDGMNRLAVGVSEIQIVRYLLETCANAREARKALLKLHSHYRVIPVHYIVGDRSGDGFVFEGRMQGHIPRFIDCDGAPLPVTNHPLRSHKLFSHEAVEESESRLVRLEQRLRAVPPGKIGMDFIQATAQCVGATEPAGQGQYIGDAPSRTLWHAFYDLEELSLKIDYYIRDDADGIQRSPQLEFRLETA